MLILIIQETKRHQKKMKAAVQRMIIIWQLVPDQMYNEKTEDSS